MISRKTLAVGWWRFNHAAEEIPDSDSEYTAERGERLLAEWLWDNRRDLLLSAEIVLGINNDIARIRNVAAKTRPKKEEKKK